MSLTVRADPAIRYRPLSHRLFNFKDFGPVSVSTSGKGDALKIQLEGTLGKSRNASIRYAGGVFVASVRFAIPPPGAKPKEGALQEPDLLQLRVAIENHIERNPADRKKYLTLLGQLPVAAPPKLPTEKQVKEYYEKSVVVSDFRPTKPRELNTNNVAKTYTVVDNRPRIGVGGSKILGHVLKSRRNTVVFEWTMPGRSSFTKPRSLTPHPRILPMGV